MKLNIVDAAGNQQTILTKAQEALTSRSGAIATTGLAQTAIDVNPQRSGFIIQNLSNNPMYVSDLGAASATVDSFRIDPGLFFPPGDYPVSTAAVSILGTSGDKFVAREW